MSESLGQKSFRGASWSGISRIAQQGLQTISISVLAHLLSPSDYGLMAMGNIFVNFLQQLGDFGTGSAIIQKDEPSPRLTSSLFWINVTLGLAGAVLLWLAAPALARYYHEPQVAPILALLALAFPATGIGIVPESLLIRDMQYRKLCVAEVGSALLGVLVSVTMAWRGAGVWSLVAGSLTLTFSSSTMLWILSAWRPLWVMDWQEIRSVFRYSLNLTGFVVVNYFARNAGQIVVGRYLGKAPLGYYQMAYSLLVYPLTALSSVLGRVIFAAFSRMQNDPPRLRAAFLRYLTLLGAVNFPVFLGLMVVAGPLVTVFLGVKWLPAVPLITILAPVGILQAISSPTGQIYLSTGRTDVMLKLGFAAAVLQVFAYFLGVHWGLQGVVLAYAVANIPVSFVALFVSHRLIQSPLRALFASLLSVLGCGVAMAAAAWGWKVLALEWGWAPAEVLFSTVAVGALTYSGAILVFRPAFGRIIAQTLSYSGIGFLQRFGAYYLGPESVAAQPAE